MATTLQQLTDIAYDILRESEDVAAYPLSFMQQLVNGAELRICSGQLVNPFTGAGVRKGQLPFLFSDKFFSFVVDTTLSGDCAVWATELDITLTTNLATAWTLYIEWNIVTYTGKSSTQVTGCSGVQFAFPAWTAVSQIYALPSDYMSPINLIFNNSAKLEMVRYDDIREEMNSRKGTTTSRIIYWNGQKLNRKPFYSIKDKRYLLVYNTGNTGDPILMRYERMPTTMSASTDLCTIENDTRARSTIPYIAIWEMLYNRWEEARASQIINFGLWQVKEMYRYYDNSTYESLSGVQYRIGKSRLNV